MAKAEFHPSVFQDLKELSLNPVQFSALIAKISRAADDLEGLTSRMRSMSPKFRKLKHDNLRAVLWESRGSVYVLEVFHRRKGYSKERLDNLLRLIRDYTG